MTSRPVPGDSHCEGTGARGERKSGSLRGPRDSSRRPGRGQIWLPYPDDYTNPWVGEFEEELYAFTGKDGRQDHRTDCLAYAVLAIDQLGYDSMTVDNMPMGVGRRPGPFQDW